MPGYLLNINMKGLILRLTVIPIVAFFPMMITVAIIGSIWDVRNLEWLFPDKNAWQVYLGWVIALSIATVVHYLYKKYKDDQELE